MSHAEPGVGKHPRERADRGAEAASDEHAPSARAVERASPERHRDDTEHRDARRVERDAHEAETERAQHVDRGEAGGDARCDAPRGAVPEQLPERPVRDRASRSRGCMARPSASPGRAGGASGSWSPRRRASARPGSPRARRRGSRGASRIERRGDEQRGQRRHDGTERRATTEVRAAHARRNELAHPCEPRVVAEHREQETRARRARRRRLASRRPRRRGTGAQRSGASLVARVRA